MLLEFLLDKLLPELLFHYLFPVLFALTVYRVIKKRIYKDKWWKIGFSVGLILSFLLILNFMIFVFKSPFILFDTIFYLFPFLLFSMVFGFSFLSFGYKYIYKGFRLLALSLFYFFSLFISPLTGPILFLVVGIVCFFVVILFRTPKSI